MSLTRRRQERRGKTFRRLVVHESRRPGYDYEEWISGNKFAYERIYALVRKIPRGRIATYGQIAGMIGRITPRMVGYAMAALRGRTDVPWQRVINCKGEISARAAGDGSVRQRKLLEGEGIRFDLRGRVDLRKVRWKGPKNCCGEQETSRDERIKNSSSRGRRKG